MRTETDLFEEALRAQVGFKTARGATIDGADCAIRVLAQRVGALALDGIVDSFEARGSVLVEVESDDDREHSASDGVQTVEVCTQVVTCLRKSDGRMRVRGRATFRVVPGDELAREREDFDALRPGGAQ